MVSIYIHLWQFIFVIIFSIYKKEKGKTITKESQTTFNILWRVGGEIDGLGQKNMRD